MAAFTEAILEGRTVELELDPALVEISHGAWEGKLWNQIPQSEIDEWAVNVMDRAAGGGESLRTLWNRVQRFGDEILDIFDIFVKIAFSPCLGAIGHIAIVDFV